jgi:hypothetical protein
VFTIKKYELQGLPSTIRISIGKIMINHGDVGAKKGWARLLIAKLLELTR